jgi:hypothetical protein
LLLTCSMLDRTTMLPWLLLAACAGNPSTPGDAPAVATATTVVNLPGAASTVAAPAPASDTGLAQLTERFVDRLDTALALDDAQTTQLRGIFATYARDLQPHVAYVRSQPTRFAKFEAARAIRPEVQRLREQTDAAIQPVLTADQYARYVELRDELREALRERFIDG